MHILSPETYNCPSWISGRERMTVENISRSISTKECYRPWRGWTRDLLVSRRTAHPTEQPRPAYIWCRLPVIIYMYTTRLIEVTVAWLNTKPVSYKIPVTPFLSHPLYHGRLRRASFRPSVRPFVFPSTFTLGVLWAQLLLQFCTDHFETLHVFSSGYEDVHVVWI